MKFCQVAHFCAKRVEIFSSATSEIRQIKYCIVVIYNYVLCWLYSMTKIIVIALNYFLIFCGILLYWV